MRHYYAMHREQRCLESAKYKADNRDSVLARQREYNETHRDEKRAGYRRWDKENPEKRRAKKHNQRARLRAAQGTHTADDVLAQYGRQKGRCFWGPERNPLCAVSIKDRYHVDHVVPIAKGGSNGPENIVLACPSCNARKQAIHPMDFAGVLF